MQLFTKIQKCIFNSFKLSLKIHIKIHTRTQLHNIYQCLLSHTEHSFAITLSVTSFDPKYESPSGCSTRTWMYIATIYQKLEVSHFYIKNVCKVYKGKINCKKPQEHLENITHFLKTPSTRNFINWKWCICCMARRRVGIPGNRDVRSNQECRWPFLHTTSTATWFVADAAGGETIRHHIRAQPNTGDKVAM